ncbi:GerW family sporulation protein [Romboutsia sp. 1001713B170131_170501_G6]|uniref:GerW family sporulation protein n=1 Tax=Romboutsia sp. 1001713B170131_170501_G6 TaxID=2787108 RepID=UPI0018AA6D67|nr:GerW family sporulation protein [Romboutsia sp. 1001713B170131_170501_G6]
MKSTNSIKTLMETTFETIKGSIDANTIIGDPIKTDTTVVVPISKVTIGFGIGGGDYCRGPHKENRILKVECDNETNFAGGSAGAVSIQPVAFVVVENGETRLMSLDNNINMVDNILAVTPKVIEKIQKLSKKDDINKKQC